MSETCGVDQLGIDTIRTLTMDAVEKARSGHPGTPMGLAPVLYVLWDKFMKHNPKNPDWANRDRFVLSAGHASMALYSVLHIMGYDLSVDDIERFRQLGSKCAGHPERGLTPGVEVTTGPLGQGAATSVGLAMARRWLASYFNRPGFDIVDYRVFSVLGDGCMMEGVTGEAASLAGHLGLADLTWIYDSNRVTIEGSTALAFSEDVETRFQAYGWRVFGVDDANDLGKLEGALQGAVAESERPSLIIVESEIAYGSPGKQGSAAAHSGPLGEEDVRGAKQSYGWDPEKTFHVPEPVQARRTRAIEAGHAREETWNRLFSDYDEIHPDLAKAFGMFDAQELPEGCERVIPTFPADPKGLSSREANGKILNALAREIPWLIGGSADLGKSNKTVIDGAVSISKDNPGGRNIHFGVREHAMGAVLNGMALSKLRPFGGTFLVFSDYMRPAIRLASMMGQPVIYVFSHDSIAVGEDGPTHQPIEQVASLRAIPNLEVIRPADAGEVATLWRYVLALKDRPVAFILSRQAIPTIDRSKYGPARGALRGGYVLTDCADVPEVILIGTGSEVQLCLGAHEVLTQGGVRTRVVSMPCMSLFERQDAAYREEVLPGIVGARVAVEAGSPQGWDRYVGRSGEGEMIGMRSFGVSAPAAAVLVELGLTVDRVVEAARRVMEGKRV